MRGVLVGAAMLAVLLGGCLQQPVQRTTTGPTAAEAAANRARPYNEGMEAVRQFSTQKGCTGEAVTTAQADIASLKDLESSFHSVRDLGLGGYANEARDRHTSLAFAFADTAKDKRCYDLAEQTYKDLINFYVGMAYGGIRDRAKIGIDDVRELRRTKPANK